MSKYDFKCANKKNNKSKQNTELTMHYISFWSDLTYTVYFI